MEHPTLDHVAVAVASLREALPVFELLLGEPGSPPETVESQGVRVSFVGPVELLEPTDPDGPVGRFLARRGPGLHHIALRVPDVAAALAACRRRGLEPVDEAPRPGARGERVAFLHPRTTAGVLVELVEERRSGGTAPGSAGRAPGPDLRNPEARPDPG